jgi:uncharacterized RDD family membrane protein YckC
MRIMVWYYKDGDQEIGPVSKNELQQLIKAKKVGAATLVRNVDMDQWFPLSEMVRGKKKPAPSQAPPPPAPPAEGIPDSAPDTEAPPTAVCSQCGRSFPQDQVLTYEDRVVCAACKPLFIQKLKEGATLPTMLQYGGFWIRFVAKIIDNIIMGMVNWAIMIPVSMVAAPAVMQGSEQFPTSGFFAFMGIQLVISISLPAAYSTYFIGRFGATLGKMACRLKVVTPEGGRVSYGRALGRFFSEMLSSMILLIGYIMAAFDDEKRTLHDRICSTRVVHK